MRLILRNLTKIVNKAAVLDRISYSFEAGLIYGLTGAKHSGKTLLFRCIAGEESFDKGKIRINRENKDEKIVFGDVGCVLHNPIIPEFLTGREFVRHFLELHDMKADEDIISEYLEIIGIDENMSHKQIYHYDDMHKEHLQLLCVYILKPDIVLVEENMEEYDKDSVDLIKKLLDELKENSVVILSAHSSELINEVCDEAVVLCDGNLDSMDFNILTLED